MAELRPGNLTELFLYFFSSFPYLPGPVMKALDASFLAPKFSRLFFQRVLHFQRISSENKEPKTTMARRVIGEWEDYHQQVLSLQSAQTAAARAAGGRSEL